MYYVFENSHRETLEGNKLIGGKTRCLSIQRTIKIIAGIIKAK